MRALGGMGLVIVEEIHAMVAAKRRLDRLDEARDANRERA
jgi:hypothetical protein